MLTPLPPWSPGGVPRVVGETARLLALRANCEVHVWAGTLERPISRIWNGVPVRTYKGHRLTVYGSVGLFRDIKRNTGYFDIVHAHCSSSTIPFIAALAQSKVPFITSAHFHPRGATPLFRLLKSFYMPTADRYTFARAKSIVCVSETEKKAIQGRFNITSDKITVIHNGVDFERIRSAVPFNVTQKVILSVSRLVEHKNVQLIIRALQYLPEEFALYIIGDGPYRAALSELINKLDLSDRIQLLGILPDDEVARWFNSCVLFVNVSEIEAFGITVLEALAAGKPVIVNNQQGLAEIASLFEGAVYPIPPNDLNAATLAKTIKRVASLGRVDVDLSDFSWHSAAQKTIELYESVIESNGNQSYHA
jgi:glycosyltransferase involved in cell wall biosynthesis